jgi:TolB protein
VRRLAALAVLTVTVVFTQAGGGSGAAPVTLLTYSAPVGDRGSAAGPGGGLCFARSDGSKRRRLTGAQHDDRMPAWSPDGKYVAFYRQERGGGTVFDVLLADTHGRVVRNLSRGYGVFNTDPTWSPDGKRLAFVASYRGSELAVVDRDGSHAHTIVRGTRSSLRTPAWSPRGNRIAFTLDPDNGPPAIYTVRPDGTDARLLIRKAADPAWSPNGAKVAYVTSDVTGEGHELAVANADGTGGRKLTSSAGEASRPAWSPRGDLIAFARGDGRSRIVTAKATGGSERTVVSARRYDALEPAWRPPVALPVAARAPCA